MIAISPERPSGAIPAPEPTNPESGIRNPESPPVLLRAEGLRKAFGGQIVLDGVDLELHQGEVVLLRGENGSGKTTLLNILTGNLEPDAGAIHYLADGSPRSYHFPRHWWQEVNPFDHFTPEFVAQEGMGRTWQDVRLFASQPLRDNIAVAEPGHPGENPLLALLTPGRCARREAEINREADAMLARFGLAGRENSSADKISLGQSKRVAIARAVAAGAQILFLDEPLAGLDGQGVRDVLALLESLVREDHVTLVIVEHVFNQPHLHGLVTTDWLLDGGKLHRNGAPAASENGKRKTEHAPSHRPSWFYLLAGDDAQILDQPLPRGALLTHIRRKGRMQNAEGRMEKDSALRVPHSEFPHKPILEIKNLVVKRGPRTVIGLDDEGNETGFNLTLHEGEIAILQAPNGWGKSTLLLAIAGLVAINGGKIAVKRKPIDPQPPWQRIGSGLRVLPSNPHSFRSLRVGEVYALANSLDSGADLGQLRSRKCSTLSGGEQQRVSLATTAFSAQTSAVLILDEPFSALDGKTSDETARTLSGLPKQALLVLVPSSAGTLS